MTAEEIIYRAMEKLREEFTEYGEYEGDETVRAWLDHFVDDEFPDQLANNKHFLTGVVIGTVLMEAQWAGELQQEIEEL